MSAVKCDPAEDFVPAMTIPQFYAGLNVLMTGGTGFIGKVLIEALLRKCPDVGNIYLLIRPLKYPLEDRVRKLTDSLLFEELKRENPSALQKIKCIPGDVSQPGLGISAEDRHLLEKQVHVIIHTAASVRFDDLLNKSVLLNVRGTRDLCDLACNMKQLKMLLHTSTAYSNCDRFYIEEKLYDAPGDWRSYIKAAEKGDTMVYNEICKKLLGRHPNTYTFTKLLAEHVVNDYRDRFPVAICRPSVVIASVSDPFTGWVDNFNGPSGLCVATAKGLIRVHFADPHVKLNCLPVDIVCKAMLATVWKYASRKNLPEVPILNLCVPKDVQAYTFEEYSQVLDTYIRDCWLEPVFYPAIQFTNSLFLYMLLFFSAQFPLSLLADLALCLKGMKPRLVRLQRRIFGTIMHLKHFTVNTWVFEEKRFASLRNNLHPDDEAVFSIQDLSFDPISLMYQSSLVIKRCLLNDKSTTEENRKALFRLKIISYALSATLFVLVTWVCLAYSIPQKLIHGMISVMRRLLVL